jgi:hypothetical protein
MIDHFSDIHVAFIFSLTLVLILERVKNAVSNMLLIRGLSCIHLFLEIILLYKLVYTVFRKWSLRDGRQERAKEINLCT